MDPINEQIKPFFDNKKGRCTHSNFSGRKKKDARHSVASFIASNSTSDRDFVHLVGRLSQENMPGLPVAVNSGNVLKSPIKNIDLLVT